MLSDLTPEQRALADYMSELSEDAYCAGWMNGLEHALWLAVTAGPVPYGLLDLSPEQVERLRHLSTACGGWIRYDEQTEETFVALNDWIARYYRRPRGRP